MTGEDEIARLIEPHIPRLRRFAWALARDGEAADDLVQDCLERAVARWHLRQGDGDLRAWLFAILRNLFLSERRRDKRRGFSLPIEQAGDVLPSIAAHQDARMGLRDVLGGIETLPDEQRDVLLLVSVEDLSYQETARVLSLPVGTVMSRLSRARESLRRYMETGQKPGLRRVK